MAVDEAAGILAMRGQPRRTVHALGRLDMVMDVAVAEMAEGQRADAGEGGGEAARIFGNEARHQVKSEEHTSELQSLMRISYAVFCLTKTNYRKEKEHNQ